MFGITFSRRLAILGGLALPVLETARRWREWPGPVTEWLPWFDDYILGAILLVAAWLSRGASDLHASDGPASGERRFRRRAWMTIGWGMVCGAGLGSTLGQLHYAVNPHLAAYPEPSGLGNWLIVLVKLGLVSIGLVGLFASTRPDRERLRS